MQMQFSRVYWLISTLVILVLLQSCSTTKRPSFYNGKIILSSTAEINKQSYQVGDTLCTISYHKGFNRGAACYLVEDGKMSNGTASIRTKSGLYANLIHKGYVDICQLGALPDSRSYTSQNIDAINEAMAVAQSVQISDGTYYLMKPVSVQSNTKILGKGDVKFVGTLVINGDNNIIISGLRFIHWAPVRTYGVWIKPRAVDGLRVDNCTFGDRVHFFADKPVGKLSDNISITNCNFKWGFGLDPAGVVSVQLHTHNLKVSHCTFDTRGLDSCLKITFGEGIVSVDSCYFKGYLDEEIFDFYTFKGDVSFTNNTIELSKGGVIRTKPGRLKNITREPYSVYVSGNKITHSGNDQNLVYIAGSYGLIDHIAGGHDIVVENNNFDCKIVNTAINIRGVEKLSIKNNSIRGRQDKSGTYSIYISSIQDLNIDYNTIEKSGIIGYIGNTPAGDTYRRSPTTASWSFTNNVFENYTSKKAPININKVYTVQLTIKNNVFKNFEEGSVLFSIQNGEYGLLNIDENSIITKFGESQPVGKSNILTRGAKLESMRINNRIIRN